MEWFGYFTEKDIELSDIAQCLEAHGYQTQSFTLVTDCMNVIFQVDENKEDYCRWSKNEDGIFDFEEEVQIELKALSPNLLTAMSIDYHVSTLSNILSLMKIVFDCYGGWVDIEGGYYNSTNLQDVFDDEFVQRLIRGDISDL
jgi:hypothetical protein